MARPPGKLYRGVMTVLASFKARAAELRREVLAIYLAAKHPRTPWYAKALLVAIVGYVLSPIDLIPDFIPVLGLLDEIVLLPFALVLVVKLVPEDVMAECRARALERRPEGAALGRIGAAFIVLVWIALIVLALMWMSAAARAQGWPSKPIRLVSPFPPGAVVDTLCRTLAPPLGEALGQPVVVENRPGAGGNVGMDFVAKAPADGYTLGMGSIATHGINPSVYARMPFDPVRDFAPITFVASNINVLVVHPSVPAHDVRELVDYARTHPGKLAYGSAGAGTSQHLAGEMLRRACPGRAVRELARVRPRIVDELAHVVRGDRRMHHQHVDVRGDEGDRREVAHRVEGHARVDARIDAVRGDAAHAERVAVGRRLRDEVHADVPACAGAVLDHDRLSERLAERRRERAAKRVDDRARRERADEADRLRRPALRPRGRAHPHQC